VKENELEVALSQMRYSLREMFSWHLPSPLFPPLELKGPRREFYSWWPTEKIPKYFRDVVRYPGIGEQFWGHKKGVLHTAYLLYEEREKEDAEYKILLGAFLHTILTKRNSDWYHGPFWQHMHNLSVQIDYEWHHASNDALPIAFTWHFHTLIKKATDIAVVGELAAVCVAMMRGCWQLVHLTPAEGDVIVETPQG
jgi:hypothetical protein